MWWRKMSAPTSCVQIGLLIHSGAFLAQLDVPCWHSVGLSSDGPSELDWARRADFAHQIGPLGVRPAGLAGLVTPTSRLRSGWRACRLRVALSAPRRPRPSAGPPSEGLRATSRPCASRASSSQGPTCLGRRPRARVARRPASGGCYSSMRPNLPRSSEAAVQASQLQYFAPWALRCVSWASILAAASSLAEVLLGRALGERDSLVDGGGAALKHVEELLGRLGGDVLPVCSHGVLPGLGGVLGHLRAHVRNRKHVDVLGHVIEQFLIHGGSGRQAKT